MENENKTLEEIAELDKKSAEIVEELNEQAKEDLANAKVIEYAISKEDANLVLNAKSQLEKNLEPLVKSFDKTMEQIATDERKFKMLESFLSENINANAVTNTVLAEVLTEQHEQIVKNISDINAYREHLINKVDSMKETINILTFKINDEGKAFVESYAITLAKILLA